MRTKNSTKNKYFLLPDTLMFLGASGDKKCLFFGKSCIVLNEWFVGCFKNKKNFVGFLFLFCIIIKNETNLTTSNYQKISLSQMYFKIGVFKNFDIFTGKHLCWSVFLIKLQACIFMNKRLQHTWFSCEYCEILRTAFLWSTSIACFKNKKFTLNFVFLFCIVIQWNWPHNK